MKPVIIASLILALVVGCSSTPNVVKEAERAEREATKQTERTIKNLPKWFMNPPETTSQVAFVVGSGSSTMLNASRDKALMNAQSQLSDQINGVVSSMQKQYIRDFGVGQTVAIEDTEIVVKKVVAEAGVSGYRVQEFVILPNGRNFDTFVMLAYPIGETNTMRAMHERTRMLNALPAQKEKAFGELQTEIEANRE